MNEDDYDFPGSKEERVQRKFMLRLFLGIVVFVAAAFGWVAYSDRGVDEEKKYLWSVVFSDPRIREHFGSVRDAHFQQRQSGRRPVDVFDRRLSGDIAVGSAAFYVVGEDGAGEVVVHYRFDHSSGERRISAIDVKEYYSKKPSQPPKPTRSARGSS